MFRVLNSLFRQPKFIAPYVDMTGKTVVVTGPTINGIGFETAASLAGMNSRVILAARNLTSAEEAASAIRNSAPSAQVDIIHCDLAQLESVSAFGVELSTIAPNGVDVLVCNAGAQFDTKRHTQEGVEMTFAVCALGHHKLIHVVQPKRLVWVTGEIYVLSKGKPDPFSEYAGPNAYMDACLARLWLAREWKSRSAADGRTMEVVCVHPGVINSEFTKLTGLAKRIAGLILINPKLGAQASVLAATAARETIHQDRILPYYHNKAKWMALQDADMAMDAAGARLLFDRCDEICGVH